MKAISSFSIRQKLLLIIVGVAALSLFVGFIFIITSTMMSLRKDMERGAVLYARLTAESLVGPVAFNDAAAAQDILDRLESVPHINHAFVFNAEDELFSFYNKTGLTKVFPQRLPLYSRVYRDNYLTVVKPVVYADRQIGVLYLKISTIETNRKISMHILTMAILFFILIGLSVVLANRLQKVISGPILNLAEITKKITENNDYSIRVEKWGEDEIGFLYDGFNDMLEQIELRQKFRNEAETALKASEEKYRKLFESISDPVIIYDKESLCIVDCNQPALQRYGYSFEEICKLTPLCFSNGADENLLFNPELHLQNLTHQTKKGDNLHVEIVTAPLIYDDKPAWMSFMRDITARKRAEIQIEQDLKEKVILLKEVHHRVKNNLQVICSLLNLQASHITDKAALDMFKVSRDRVRSMALVHEQLYQSNDFSQIDFARYIKRLTSSLFSAYNVHPGNVKLTIDTQDVILGVNTAVPCGIIVNELISNSLKHAFSENSNGENEIKVKLIKNENDAIVLQVRDNGKGFPADYSLHRNESLGIRLVTLLAEEQLSGKVEMKGENGTEFIITFNDCY